MPSLSAPENSWLRRGPPSVTVGLLKPADLAGYRNDQVYIRKSMHVPLNREAVRDAMPAFFDLMREESHPAVRVVLGISCSCTSILIWMETGAWGAS